MTPYTVRAIWAVEDIVTFKNLMLWPSDLIHGFGYCYERYKKREQEWRITGYRLERLMMDYAPRPIAKQHPV